MLRLLLRSSNCSRRLRFTRCCRLCAPAKRRGVLRPGFKADINVIDLDRLHIHAPERIHDLPAGGGRLVQRVDGYRATLCAGQVIFENGKPTGAMPGKLLRGPQAAPAS